eukprot:TRINITY_DN1180_c0_g1_i1.p1 TRINITY_DN1180_c0_g1~~TRINITY_DN1180_c0_g1_i1.p1  ORF type:complete len:213 (-),score=5.80 TRINITY_DN1180_c0_g1_i1:83-721(-)
MYRPAPPTLILSDPCVWLGPCLPEDSTFFEDTVIDVVLQCSPQKCGNLDGEQEVFEEILSDSMTEPLNQKLPKLVELIDLWRSQNKSVYVHCQLGVSRSASVVIGYVAMQLELSYNDSMAFVKRLKPDISPNPAFQYHLSNFCLSDDIQALQTSRECTHCFQNDLYSYQESIGNHWWQQPFKALFVFGFASVYTAVLHIWNWWAPQPPKKRS